MNCGLSRSWFLGCHPKKRAGVVYSPHVDNYKDLRYVLAEGKALVDLVPEAG
jgi:hypothetical protein